MQAPIENALCGLQPRNYSLAEAEVVLGVSRTTLYRWLRSRRLRTVKLGRRRLVPPLELARLMSTDSPVFAIPSMPNSTRGSLTSEGTQS
jgi:excisionase family DNA binding protein